MTLKANFSQRLDGFTLDANFELPSRGCHFIFGPSGAGKSTLLHCLAGLSNKAYGFCSFRHDIWQNDKKNIFTPPHQRQVGYMLQGPSLFPHLSVRKNLLFGLERTPAEQRAFDFENIVDELELAPLLTSSPDNLSGGQGQRVALGRTLLASPRVLLLDEPFNGLDEKTKERLFSFLSKVGQEKDIPVYYVTHDLEDVLKIGEEILLLNGGRIQRFGPLPSLIGELSDLASHERESFSLLQTQVDHFDEKSQLLELNCEGKVLFIPKTPTKDLAQTNLYLKVDSSDVSISLDRPSTTSILNIVPVTIREIQDLTRAEVLLTLSLGEQDLFSKITKKSLHNLELKKGGHVYAQIKSVSLIQ